MSKVDEIFRQQGEMDDGRTIFRVRFATSFMIDKRLENKAHKQSCAINCLHQLLGLTYKLIKDIETERDQNDNEIQNNEEQEN